MKLFDNFEAIKFPEENSIFITKGGYLYYIYDSEHDYWKKYKNAGWDQLTVGNYPDITKEELVKAFGGEFPQSETDIRKHCSPEEWQVIDMQLLLEHDYAEYMGDRKIYRAASELLFQSDLTYKAYEKLGTLFEEARKNKKDAEQVLDEIKELYFFITGGEIFKREIGIVDGYTGGSYFDIMPVRVIDYSDTDSLDNVATMEDAAICVEEDDVNSYLTPFLYKYFDDNLEVNKKRLDYCWEDEEGRKQYEYTKGFEWYLTYNYYTFEAIENILVDIRDTVDALLTGRKNEYTEDLKIKTVHNQSYTEYFNAERDMYTVEEWKTYEKELQETIDEHSKGYLEELNLIIDFYERFVYRMEYMIRIGKEKGYSFISFSGP